MRIVHGTRSLESPLPASILTIGNFDGVHVGHQALVDRVVELGRKHGVPSVVMTFEPHPVKVLHPDRKLHRIFDLDDLAEQMEMRGVDTLVIEPFSREFSQLPPERYLLEWIFRPFGPQTLVVGYDFSFGANRQGSIDFLKERAGLLGVEVEVMAPVKVGDVLVSSTRIRQAIETGDVELASRLLGRRFYVDGLVERGAGRGRKIGVPTANLRTMAETVPALGVYACFARVQGKTLRAAVNVGYNPTFIDTHASRPSIEAHLIDYSKAGGAELYGEPLYLEFVQRLREERKFPSVEALVAQIKNDIQDASRVLAVSGEPK